MTGLDVEAVLRDHEPVLGRMGPLTGIVGCSCLSARDYRAAGLKAGQAGWRAHVAGVLRVEIESALGDAMREAEKVVVAFLDAAPCWKAPGERAMVDCAVEDLSADVARLFAEMRGEPRPPSRRPYHPTLAATEGDVR